MRYVQLSISLFVMLLAIAGCDFSQNDLGKKTQTQTSMADKAKSTMISYEKYRSMYQDMVDHLQFQGFEKVFDESERPSILLVDKEVAFGKRTALTITGTTDSMKPTQYRTIYRDSTSHILLYLDFIYLSNSLEPDMVMWEMEPPAELKDSFANARKFDENILSYYNTLVKLTAISENEDPISVRLLSDVAKNVVVFLQSNQLPQ